MKEFEVEITETLSKIIKIKANTFEEANNIVAEMYKQEKIVLSSGDFRGVSFVDANEQSKKHEKDLLIRKIIDYLYHDEEKHFKESGEPKNHIYSTIKALDALID